MRELGEVEVREWLVWEVAQAQGFGRRRQLWGLYMGVESRAEQKGG